MADEKRYSVEEAAKELGTGVSTLLLWKHIYSEFLSGTGDAGEQTLSREDIHLFTYISECTESGLTREEIRLALRNRAAGQGPLFSRNAFRHDDDDDILSLLDEDNPTPALLARLVIQQRRLAEAEERKASAMERRIAVEEEKSRSLSAILTALTTSGLPVPAMQAAQQAPYVQPTVPAEPSEPETPRNDSPPRPEQAPEKTPLDNHFVPETDDVPLDDLSALVDAPAPLPQEDVDDLWSLIEDDAPGQDPDMDNLWDLVDTPVEEDLDDLWALLDETPGKGEEEEPDNLWDLIDEPPREPEKAPMSDTGLDDLWTVEDEPPVPPATPEKAEKPTGDADNLWNLVDTPPREDQPRPVAEQTPKKMPRQVPRPAEEPSPLPSDPEAYKDFILKEIIGMKRREGLSAAQVAERLNEESRPTFSGKGSWGARTIEGIFSIIEKAGPK
ncbi:MerR family transcriptional regulator [Desulfoluna spongiiphila]|uniref:Uncharacterized protein n=1 Tax=Desulfoluna spongiiphila TaxID=419481 RepID=A0A1G5F2H9_9BACT|nr:MerR family transcriptional regulator [Desulfoluna spongiiphila]SCY33384.1 hypothetical protein SAMN05216233_10791 [Desulfoluna spongiiphila]